MKRYLFGAIGLAFIGAISLIGQALAVAGESCSAEAASCPEAACNAGCNGMCNGGCNDGCRNCPQCGCRMEPVCHPTCETKKETVHKYCCTCKDICIPHVTPICQGGGECCDNGCDGCCRVRTVHKLVIHPVTKEKQVRGCTVTWTCAHCGSSATTSIPSMAPAAPDTPVPAPAPNANRLPPPPKTTETAPLPQDVRTAQAAF